MAGKKGMKGSGGARPGAGRKKMSISEQESKKLLASARRKAKETGKEVWDVLMDMIYSKRLQTKDPRAVQAAIKIYADAVIAKQMHQTADIEIRTGPTIFLPEKYPAGEQRDMGHLKRDEEDLRH